MRYAYYPGCSLESTSREFDWSIRFVFKALGLELVEIPDWVCCGASATHYVNHTFAVALPALALFQAEEMGIYDVVAPCAECFSRLMWAKRELDSDESLKKEVERLIGKSYSGKVRVRNLLDVFINDVGLDRIKEASKASLRGLRVASYYGCLITRPRENCTFDDTEYPISMDRIVEVLGGDPVDWPKKTDCCGATLSITQTDHALSLCKDIIVSARRAGATCIVCSCPLCQANLDMRQPQVVKKFGLDFTMPILYITQLMGLSFGGRAKELGLNRLVIPPSEGLSLSGLF